MTGQTLIIYATHARIVQLLSIWQITQVFRIKRHEELLRRHKRIGRTTARAPRTHVDKSAHMQPLNQITADLFAKNVL